MRAKYQIYEIEDLDPRPEVEWLDHSYLPFQTLNTHLLGQA
jgi:hypothetical protein